jgi:hypothetical protein
MPAVRGYKRLHAAQLVKHYFGLAQLGERPLTLLYLYWLPTNWAEITVRGPNGASINPFEAHREEVARFADAVPHDEATGVRFESMSTLDLFAQWGELHRRDWRKTHLEAMKTRYAVPVRRETVKELSPEFLRHLIEIGESERFDELDHLHERFPFSRSGSFMGLVPEAWYEVADSLGLDELEALIKTLTVAEDRLPGCRVGSVSPVIWLRYRAHPRWSADENQRIREWIRGHSQNFYLIR